MNTENLFKVMLCIFAVLLAVSWMIPQANAEPSNKPTMSYGWVQVTIDNQEIGKKSAQIYMNITYEPFDAAGTTIPADKKHIKYKGGPTYLLAESGAFY